MCCYYLNKINIQFPSMPFEKLEKERKEERETKINSILDLGNWRVQQQKHKKKAQQRNR